MSQGGYQLIEVRINARTADLLHLGFWIKGYSNALGYLVLGLSNKLWTVVIYMVFTDAKREN